MEVREFFHKFNVERLESDPISSGIDSSEFSLKYKVVSFSRAPISFGMEVNEFR
jgi:hypothetical protein